MQKNISLRKSKLINTKYGKHTPSHSFKVRSLSDSKIFNRIRVSNQHYKLRRDDLHITSIRYFGKRATEIKENKEQIKSRITYNNKS